MRYLFSTLLTLLLALISGSCEQAKSTPPARPAAPPIGRLSPTDSEVLRRAVTRVGGEEVLKQVKSLRMLGSLEGEVMSLTHIINFELEAGRRSFVVSRTSAAGFRQYNFTAFASAESAGMNFNNTSRASIHSWDSAGRMKRELLVYLHPVFLLRHLGTAAANVRLSDKVAEANKLAVVISLPTKRDATLVFDRTSATLLEVRAPFGEGNDRERTLRFSTWSHYPLWPKGLRLPMCTTYEPHQVLARRVTNPADPDPDRLTRDKVCTFTILVNDPPVSRRDIERDVNTNVGFPSAQSGYGPPSRWP